jgi:hypothetical protein
MRKITIYLIVFLLVGCTSMHFSNYYPYSKVPPQKLKSLYPIEYEDCMTLLDSILSNAVINNFKNTDTSIATIEISDGIGGFFITNWGLNKYGETKGTTYNMPRQKIPDMPIDLPSRFIHDGIPHPSAMIRVMFNCYHKYLNNKPYNWNQEIEEMKSYWINPETVYYYTRVPDTIAKLENRILVNYRFDLLNKNDTVDILYNRAPRLTKKSPDWYYLTGTVKYKLPKTKEINIELIEIKSEFGDNFLLAENDTIFIGDTLTDYSKGWLKRGMYYFNYNRNTEYRSGFQ